MPLTSAATDITNRRAKPILFLSMAVHLPCFCLKTPVCNRLLSDFSEYYPNLTQISPRQHSGLEEHITCLFNYCPTYLLTLWSYIDVDEHAPTQIPARMANRGNSRWTYACSDNRHVEGEPAERKSACDASWNGLPNDKASFECAAEEQNHHFGG